ncbi:MAG: SRPBCC family protein, partial [Gemmatimonadota bacterium]
ATMLLPMPLEEAMECFTPDGEREWLEGWEPEFLFRSDEDGVDTAFRTTHDGEETLWMVLDMDLEEGSAGYARITPGSRMGTVMIDGEAIDETSCWITVTYELTALSPAGNAVLKAMTPAAYKTMIGEWERAINDQC